jgi:outer membrane protein assembly factor BamB
MRRDVAVVDHRAQLPLRRATVHDARMTPILVYANQSMLHGLDAASGQLVWKQDLVGYPIELAIRGQRVLALATGEHDLHCFEYTTGRLLWRAPIEGHPNYRAYIVLGDDRIFVQRADRVECFTPDGARLWSHRDASLQQMAALGVPDFVRNDPRT